VTQPMTRWQPHSSSLVAVSFSLSRAGARARSMDTAAQQAAGIESQLAAPESGGGTVTDTSPIVLVLTVDLGNGDFSRCVTQV
jgi:hypothetical protein